MFLYHFTAYRLNDFVVGLTNEDPMTTAPVYKSSYTLCAQYNGSVAPFGNATVHCAPSSEKYRFVIVQGSHTTNEAVCLKEVAVYAVDHESVPGREYAYTYSTCIAISLAKGRYSDISNYKVGVYRLGLGS